eukprot:6182869-Pleurochrysis_carterae.AAC.7
MHMRIHTCLAPSPTNILATAPAFFPELCSAEHSSFGAAQVENIITRAHGIRQGIWQTLRTTYSVGSWRALIFPPGLLMMMAREVCCSTFATADTFCGV